MSETPFNSLSEIIGAYWPVLALSFAVSVGATPICRRVALRFGFVDRPDDWLKPHEKPIPYAGGVAILLGWLAGIGYALIRFASDAAESSDGPHVAAASLGVILIAGTAIAVIGLIDDLKSISPRLKLAATAAVGLLLVLSGLGDELILAVTGSIGVRFGPDEQWLVYAYSVPASLFLIVGACNAANLIDGLDGLCSGVLAIIAAGFLFIAVHMHLYSHWDPRDLQRVVLSLALLGSAVGFLPFNRNPAKIFMGDAGSMLLGLNAAILLLLFAEENRLKWMLGSLMVFGLPVADMALALVRRWRAQKPVMLGDRSHFYDQLVDRGLDVRTVVRISYGLTLVFVLMGLMVIPLRTRHIILIYGLFLGLIAWAIHHFRMVRTDDGPRAAADSAPNAGRNANSTSNAGQNVRPGADSDAQHHAKPDAESGAT